MDSSVRDEIAEVVLADLARWPRVHARVVVFANEKGGVGKSTLAFHCAVELARGGSKVLAIDLDRRQQSLARAIECRAATARSFGVALPGPRISLPENHSTSMLLQEIARLGSDCDTVIIDLPGQDSPIARRAIALADVLVTPVNPNFVDLSSLARINPVSGRMSEPGSFARMVCAIRAARRTMGPRDLEWLMVKNRVRSSERRQLVRFDAAAAKVAKELELKLCGALSERVAYRDLYAFGLTHEDCRALPGLHKTRLSRPNELTDLLASLRAAGPFSMTSVPVAADRQVRRQVRSLSRYRDALREHVGAVEVDHKLAVTSSA